MEENKEINKSLKKLKKMASSYSFGRILGLISYKENTIVSVLLGQDFKKPSERLINNEIAFLAALWLENYKNDNRCFWKKEDDIQKLNDVYRFMDLYHQSLKSNEFGKVIRETAVYEGDGGYDWQFIELAISKYACVKDELLTNFNFNLDVVASFYEKLKNYVRKKVERPDRRYLEQIQEDGAKVFDLFQISKKEFESIFNADELGVANMFISKLGCYKGQTINDIFDFNEYNSHPIIELSDGNLLIFNYYFLAKVIYESPYYWIRELDNNELLVRMGHGSENAANYILRKIGFDPITDVKINRSKKENDTDIDLLVLHDKEAVVFQVKSQKLTIKARQGIEENIIDNFGKAVIKAYHQGVKSVESIKNKDKHKELLDIEGLENIDKYHIICLTADYYPTITPVCLSRQDEVASTDYPLIGMTLFDLLTICDLLDKDSFIKYLNFREKCAVMKIYGHNEMYYLGKFIEPVLDIERPLFDHQRLPNDYAMLIDKISLLHYSNVKNNALNYYINNMSQHLYIKELINDICYHLNTGPVTRYDSLIVHQ